MLFVVANVAQWLDMWRPSALPRGADDRFTRRFQPVRTVYPRSGGLEWERSLGLPRWMLYGRKLRLSLRNRVYRK